MIPLKKKIIIAIDGYSSCGKSSFAKLIASSLGYIHLDSGAMYRAVALFAVRENLIQDNRISIAELIEKLPGVQLTYKNNMGENHICLNGLNVEKEIRSISISSLASTISKIRQVREYLVHLQQVMGKEKGIVMDGRDIGTVVFPQAEVKIFMTADVNVRATRRFLELKEKGITASLDDVKKDIATRDKQDTTREISPLRKADDAVILDNSSMTFDDQMHWFHQLLINKNLVSGNS